MYIYLYFMYIRIYSHLLLYLPHFIDHIKCLTRYVKKNFLWKKYQKSDEDVISIIEWSTAEALHRA